MTAGAGFAGRVLLAAVDGDLRLRLQGCLAGRAVQLAIADAQVDLADLDPETIDAVVIDEAYLDAANGRVCLGTLHAAGVPIVLVAPHSAWAPRRAELRAAGLELFDCLCPGDTCDVIAMRLATALRLVRAERAAEVLRATHLEVERNRVVAQLAGAVAHKLKQPLSVAWGYLELLLDDDQDVGLELSPLTLRYLTEIREAVRTMDDVVNRLQRATVYQTRRYAGALEILDIDEPAAEGVEVRG